MWWLGSRSNVARQRSLNAIWSNFLTKDGQLRSGCPQLISILSISRNLDCRLSNLLDDLHQCSLSLWEHFSWILIGISVLTIQLLSVANFPCKEVCPLLPIASYQTHWKQQQYCQTLLQDLSKPIVSASYCMPRVPGLQS